MEEHRVRQFARARAELRDDIDPEQPRQVWQSVAARVAAGARDDEEEALLLRPWRGLALLPPRLPHYERGEQHAGDHELGVPTLLVCFACLSKVLGGRLVVKLSPITALCKQKMHLL